MTYVYIISNTEKGNEDNNPEAAFSSIKKANDYVDFWLKKHPESSYKISKLIIDQY